MREFRLFLRFAAFVAALGAVFFIASLAAKGYLR